MRKIFLILSLFTTLFAAAQTGSWTPISGNQRFTKGLGIPVKDTFAITRPEDSAQVVIRPQDSTMYYVYKGRWKKGTATLTGTSQQIPFFSGTNILSASDSLKWDYINQRLHLATSSEYTARFSTYIYNELDGINIRSAAGAFGKAFRVTLDTGGGTELAYITAQGQAQFYTAGSSNGDIGLNVMGTGGSVLRANGDESVYIGESGTAPTYLARTGTKRYFYNTGGPMAIQSAGGNLLLGGDTDSAGYKVQLTGPTLVTGVAKYAQNYGSMLDARSLVNKGYVDSADALRLKYTDTASMLSGYKKLNVISWGNSLTFGTGSTSTDSTWPSQASRLSGYNFVNKGIPGETATEINARVYAASADTLLMPSVFWAMENTADTAQMTSALDSFVNKINHNRWVAVSPILREGNPIGNQVYDEQRKWTADAFKKYGNHIVDMQYWLLNFGDGSSNDNTDIANGVIPRSLRVDAIHLNDKGYRVVAQRILQQLSFFTQGDNAYNNGVSISSMRGTPISNGNGLFLFKRNNHSYVNSFSATTPYAGGDTLTIQNSAGVVNIAPSNGSIIRTGFLPARTTPSERILVRGSNSDTSQLAYVSSGQIASSNGDIIVTDGANSTVNKNVDLALATVNSSPATYGSATQVPQFTVDSKGRVTGVVNTNIAIPQSAVTNLTTDLASKANISGQTFTGTIGTTAGNGAIIGGGAYYISPSSTRGVLQINGSSDQFINLGTNGYLFGSSTLNRWNSGTAWDLVVNGSVAMSASTSQVITIPNLSGSNDRLVQVNSSGVLSATSIIPTSGTYTPTASNAQNAGTITAYGHQYTRIGNIVTVSGVVQYTTTASGVVSAIEITLPFSTTFTSTLEATGTATCSSNFIAGYVSGNNLNNKAVISFKAGASGTVVVANYTFQYQVL